MFGPAERRARRLHRRAPPRHRVRGRSAPSRARRATRSTIVPRLDQPMIVVARDLSPADTAGMVREPAIAFVTEVGTRTSHTAIMARALEIPAVVGVADALCDRRTGDIAHRRRPARRDHRPPERADDRRGARARRPAPRVRARAAHRAQPAVRHARRRAGQPQSERRAPGRGHPRARPRRQGHRPLPDGVPLHRPDDAADRGRAVRALSRRRRGGGAAARSTLRTFDIGGDKFATSFQLPAEMNPALGLRAVRLAL